MAYQQKNNTGTMFKNKFKKTAEQPDYRGSILINNTKFDIASWVKVPKPKVNPDGTETQGEKYQFVMISVPREKTEQGNSQQKKQQDVDIEQGGEFVGDNKDNDEIDNTEVPF